MIPILFVLLVLSKALPLTVLTLGLLMALLLTLNLYLGLKTPGDIKYLNYFGLTVEIILISVFLWLAKTPLHVIFLIYILLIITPALIESLKFSLYGAFWVTLWFILIKLYLDFPIKNWGVESWELFLDVIPFWVIAVLAGTLADKLRAQNLELQKTIADLSRTTREKEFEKQKVKFMMTTSHQLNTPVSEILNSSSLLLEQREKLPEKQQRYLQIINNSTLKLGQTIKKMVSGFERQIGQEHSNLNLKEMSEVVDEASLEVEKKDGKMEKGGI